MGFSFSALSLVPTAAAELGAGDVVQRIAGRPGSKQFLSASQPARAEEDGSSDSETGWPAPALCACVDGRPSQPQDVPSQSLSQSLLFSSLWTSAVETSEPQSSSASQTSLSILASGELLFARGVSHEGPSAVIADNGEPAADFLGAGSPTGNGLSANALGSDQALLIPGAGLLMRSAAAGSAAVDSKAGAAAAENGAENTAASPDAIAAEGDGAAELLADHHGVDFSDAGGAHELPPALPADAAARLAEPRPIDAAVNHAQVQRPSPNGSTPRPEGPVSTKEEPVSAKEEPAMAADAATRQAAANVIALPFAIGTELPNSNAPNTTAGATARPAAPHTNTLPPMPQGVSATADADASAAQETPLTPQAEIAFQAELQLNNSQDGSNTPVSHSQRDTLTRWTASLPREDLSANPAGSHGQPKSKAAAQNAETIETAQTIAFRSAGEHPDTGGSSLGQGHAGGNIERGAQQTTPLSQGPFVMNSQPRGEGVLSSRTPAAAPAAAHLDAAAPDAPAETGPAARSVALKIQSEQHGAANVVLTDRGGQVHVTVRSGDAALTNALRSDLGSLAGGLQQHGFDVRFWNRSSGSGMDAEARGNSNEFSGQDDVPGQARHRHSPDDAGHRHRRGEWIEEFD